MIYRLEYRYCWLALYLLINIIAGSYTFLEGKLLGDFLGLRFENKELIFFSTICVTLSYLFFMLLTFNYFYRLNLGATKYVLPSLSHITGARMNLLLAAVNLLFIFFNLTFEVNIAGGLSETNSPLRIIWIFFSPDLIFFLSLAYLSKSKYFLLNIILFVVSAFLRGWSGFILTLIFFWGWVLFDNRRISIKKTLLIGVLVLSIYPLIKILKFIIRGGRDINSLQIYLSETTLTEYFSAIGDGVLHIVGRLNTAQPLAVGLDNFNFLQDAFSEGLFPGFWEQNLFVYIVKMIFSVDKLNNFETWLVGTHLFNHEVRAVGASSTSLSNLIWFVVSPFHGILYLLNLLFVTFMIIALDKLNGSSKQSQTIIWWFLVVYIMPPWLEPFSRMIITFMLFTLLRLIIQKFDKFSFKVRA